jgi:hypothetical protein
MEGEKKAREKSGKLKKNRSKMHETLCAFPAQRLHKALGRVKL